MEEKVNKERFIPIDLPSGCITYDGIDPKSIKIRPLTAGDEVLLAEINASNMSRNLLTLIDRILIGVKPELLTKGDTTYIMLWEMINSYTNMYPVDAVCESCFRRISIQVDLGTIDSIPLAKDFIQPREVKLSEGSVNLRLLTLGDEDATYIYSKENESGYLYTYACSIVDGEAASPMRLKLIRLANMSTQDFAKIKDFQIEHAHGPDMVAPYVCPKCKEEGKLVVPFRFDKFV